MSDLSVILVLIFLAASLAIYALYWIFVFNRTAQKTLNRRLDLQKSLGASVVLETLRRERSFRDESNPVLRQISDWLTQTGIRVQRRTLALIFTALCLALLLIFSQIQILGIGLISLASAVLVAATGIFLYLARSRSKRILAFTEQLPDAIDVIVRGVRVGFPLSSAVALVGREMPDPIGTEFGMFADEMAFGLDVQTALRNLYRRVGQEDLLFLTIALNIQTQTGGNIGEILGRLSRLMRRRTSMRLKINALTAEGRLSGWALSAMPIVLILLINFASPGYYDSVRSSSLFEPIIIVGLLLLLVGNIVIYRMVNFKY